MPNQIIYYTCGESLFNCLTVVNRYVASRYCGESLNYLTLRYMYIIPGLS